MEWQLKEREKMPKYQAIMKLVTENIQSGHLLGGEVLPAERQLADLLGVNRSTIVRALSELEAKGIVKRKQGSGTRINDEKWGLSQEPVVDWHQFLPVAQPGDIREWLAQLQQRQKIEGAIDAYTGELPFDLVPAFDLPQSNWRDFIKADKAQDDLGYLPLRQAISDLLVDYYGFRLVPEQLMLTSGGHQAIFLLVQTLLNSGDSVAISQPSFLYALTLFQTAGIRLYGVPMDEEGLRLDALENEILKHRVKLVMLNPTFQNPTGQSMSLKRRKALIKLCQRYQVPIVEDDAFGFLAYNQTSHLPPLKQLDPHNVIYIGSLSKMMGSTTKIGWISAPPAILKTLSLARQDLDLTLSIFPQVLANYALTDETFEIKITRLRRQLAARMTYFFEQLGSAFSYQRPKGGFYVWLRVPEEWLTKKSLTYLIDLGILGLPSFIFGDKKPAIRLTIARLSFDEIDGLIEKLRQAKQDLK